MGGEKCLHCDADLTKDDVGLSKRLLGRDAERFYCIDCLAVLLEADREFLLERVKEYKDDGCELFF